MQSVAVLLRVILIFRAQMQMRLTRFPFLLAATILLPGCSDKGLQLAYDVTVRQTGTVDVALEVKGISDAELTLSSYEHESYLGLKNVTVTGSQGDPLPYEKTDSAAPVARLRADTRDRQSLRVEYQVTPGRPIRAGEGKHATDVNGYIGDNFGLLSGRGLFLVPDASIADVTVQVRAPKNWHLETTWRRGGSVPARFHPRVYNDGPEDLLNATIGLGALQVYEKTVASAPVRVAVYTGWPAPFRQELADRVFDLYARATDLMAAPIADPYTVIFTPKSNKNLGIHTYSSGHGQGRDMNPPTPTRWIGVVENMMNRWLRHEPHRMEFATREDMWFVDGAAVYSALLLLEAAGLIADAGPYVTSAYRRYNRGRLTSFKNGIVPATFYPTSSSGMVGYRRHAGLALAHYLDWTIWEQSGHSGLRTVLPHAYRQRRGIGLAGVVAEATGVEMSAFTIHHLKPDSPPEEPLWYKDGPAPGAAPQRLPWSRAAGAAVDTLTLVLTGHTQSFLEACGCKANMSGGITRRATLIKQIRRRRDDVLVVDAGNLFPQEKDVPRMDALTATEIDTYLGALRMMGYGAAGVARNELFYGGEFLTAKAGASSLPVLGANVRYKGERIGHPVMVLKWGQYEIGLIGVVQDYRDIGDYRYEENVLEFEVDDPVAAVGEYLTPLRGQVDFVGVVGGLTTEGVYALVEAYSDSLDLIVPTGHHYPMVDVLTEKEVARHKDALHGFLDGVLILYANGDVYGLHQFDLGIDDGGKFATVDGTFLEAFEDMPEDPFMKQYLDAYYERVAREERLLEGKIVPLFEWDPNHQGARYVGTTACSPCHAPQFEHWQQTGHASAYATLLDAHRHQFPKCVKCHVVGLGRPQGFSILDPKRDLANVQCEVCHGPGGRHVEKPSRTTIQRTPEERTCLECHNADHDDDFNYQKDFASVRH